MPYELTPAVRSLKRHLLRYSFSSLPLTFLRIALQIECVNTLYCYSNHAICCCSNHAICCYSNLALCCCSIPCLSQKSTLLIIADFCCRLVYVNVKHMTKTFVLLPILFYFVGNARPVKNSGKVWCMIT